MAAKASSYTPWSLDYAAASSEILSRTQRAGIRDPPGYAGKGEVSSKKAGKAVASSIVDGKPTLGQIRAKRAWELALSPAKNVPMQAFILWMSGNTVQIFSMLSVGNLLRSSLSSMLGVNKVFAPFVTTSLPNASGSEDAREADAMIPQKAVYLLCQAALLALAVWKCSSMGLLPNASSDWLAFKEPPVALEWSASPAI